MKRYLSNSSISLAARFKYIVCTVTASGQSSITRLSDSRKSAAVSPGSPAIKSALMLNALLGCGVLSSDEFKRFIVHCLRIYADSVNAVFLQHIKHFLAEGVGAPCLNGKFAGYLIEHTRYSRALKGTSAAQIHRGALEQFLREDLKTDINSLMPYMSYGAKKFAERCRRIFAVCHCFGRFLILAFYNRKSVFGAYFIGYGSDIFKRFFILMKFLSAFKTDTVYDDVIVQMIFFNVRSDDYFAPVKTFFCESDADFVYGFRCDFFFRTERLTVVIKVSAVCL